MAQLEAQEISTLWVGGSSPSEGVTKLKLHMDEQYYKSVLHRLAIAYELGNQELLDKWLQRIYAWSRAQREVAHENDSLLLE